MLRMLALSFLICPLLFASAPVSSKPQLDEVLDPQPVKLRVSGKERTLPANIGLIVVYVPAHQTLEEAGFWKLANETVLKTAPPRVNTISAGGVTQSVYFIKRADLRSQADLENAAKDGSLPSFFNTYVLEDTFRGAPTGNFRFKLKKGESLDETLRLVFAKGFTTLQRETYLDNMYTVSGGKRTIAELLKVADEVATLDSTEYARADFISFKPKD